GDGSSRKPPGGSTKIEIEKETGDLPGNVSFLSSYNLKIYYKNELKYNQTCFRRYAQLQEIGPWPGQRKRRYVHKRAQRSEVKIRLFPEDWFRRGPDAFAKKTSEIRFQ